MDLAKIMDEQSHEPISDKGKDLDAEFEEFRNAYISNPDRVRSILMAMKAVTEKTIAMIGVANNEEDATKAAKSELFNKPILAMAYFGFKIGKRAQRSISESDSLEAMFRSEGPCV